MGTPGAWQTIRMQASLIATPSGSTITGDPPYGGVYLGQSRDVKVQWGFTVGTIVDEGFMDPFFGAVANGFGAVATCILRAVDKDAIQKVFLNTKLGTWNDRKVYEAPKSTDSGYRRPGAVMEALNFKLLIAPKDETRHPFFVFYNAMPVLAEDAVASYMRSEEFGLKVGFHACCDTDATARRFDWGRKGSLTL
jgi:hypothetical protein